VPAVTLFSFKLPGCSFPWRVLRHGGTPHRVRRALQVRLEDEGLQRGIRLLEVSPMPLVAPTHPPRRGAPARACTARGQAVAHRFTSAPLFSY